nr:unnamed protein product [Haemonchus contortus]
MFNYYTLVLPILSMFYMRKVKSQRLKNIRENININTVGAPGWINYSAILQKQWQ